MLTLLQHDNYTLYLPPSGVVKLVTLQDLVRFCNLLKTADYKGCDSFFETTLNTRNGTQSCLRAVRSVTMNLDGKSYSQAAGGTEGLASTEVATYFGNYLSKLLT